MRIKAGLALLALLLAGCTVGPNFEAPNPWSPLSWFRRTTSAANPSRLSMPVAEPVDPEWWSVLHDPVLTGLMRRVAASNLDVRVASLRLAEARAQAGVTAAGLYPSANGNASYTREKISEVGAVSALSSGSNPATQSNGLGGREGGIPTSVASGGSNSKVPPFDLFQTGFDASWELDLWGRVRRQVESANATAQASQEAQYQTLITSLAELARDYVQLRGYQESERIVRSNLATAQDSVRLTRDRFQGGLATDLDVANAQAQAEATAAALPPLEQQEQQTINAISLLLGEAPGALAAELNARKPVPPVPPRVPIGLPSELARRRPDIRQAEAQLHSATADIGAAQADFYPRVTLSGSWALQSTQLGSLFTAAAQTYSLGPSLTVPIFEGGRLRRTLQLRQAQQQEAAVNYQKTVLQAFHDVDNALIAYRTDQLRRDRLAAQVTQSRRALGFATDRFKQGVSDYLEVLTAQRTVLQAEQALADATTAVSTDLVALYKALGGGWQTTARG
ncbi:MAG: efflux transporter outer membrane subunit [Acetobacteraceae bacterium]|nr:efflux transporter outer membrane subunit [Acetobacteraceae bacterium]